MADLWNASWRAAAGGLRPVVAATGEFRPSQSKLTKLLVPNLLGFQGFRHEPAEKSNETCASRLEYFVWLCFVPHHLLSRPRLLLVRSIGIYGIV
jgi:hypothetical protein